MALIRNENIKLRTIHGSIFLIDISDNYSGDTCALYEINETGRFLWENLDVNMTISNLAKALQEAIVDDVSFEEIKDDTTEFIRDLTRKGFVLEVDSNG